MTTRWIVGIDDSEAAVTALRWAARFTEDRDVTLTAVSAWHVSRPIALLGAKRGFDVDGMGMEAEAAVLADHAVEQIVDDGVVPEDRLVATTVDGRPGPALVAEAEDASALVVGRHGHEAWHHGLGSVSRYCATHSSVPVIVVPETAADDAVTRVVVGFDGGDASLDALRWAAEHAPDEASVTAIGVIEGPPWLGLDKARERYGEPVEEEEKRLTAAFADADVARATLTVEMGDSRVVLLDAADEADLVVIGGPSHGRLGTMILGSTATWLLHATTCPVVVTR